MGIFTRLKNGGPTLIFVPTQIHYRHGYCASTSGARVTSARGSDLLEVQNARSGRRVTVQVTPGRCVAGVGRSTQA